MVENTKLTDREVRIIYLPPMTVASIHCIGGAPETETGVLINKFIQENNLAKNKPDFRHFGFNHPSGKLPDGSDHGFERWVSIPEDIVVQAPFKKQKFLGGLFCSIMRPLAPIELFMEGWQKLYTWIIEHNKYEIVAGDPEKMNGMMNEHLNWFNKFSQINDPSDPASKVLDEESLQLDLLIPIKEKK
jgi:hypothetical protein